MHNQGRLRPRRAGGQVQTGGHFRTQPGLGSICQFRHQYITSQRYRPCKPWDLSSLRAYIIVWADFLTSPSTCSWIKDQERHFNFFLGANFFKFFNATEKLKKNSTLYSYLTLFIVLFFLSFFPSSFFFLFSFFLVGRRPPSRLKWRPWEGKSKHRVAPRIFMESTLSMPEIGRVRVRSASFALGLHTYLLSRDVRRVLKEFRNWISRHNYIASGSAFQLLKMREWRMFARYDVFTGSEWMTTCDVRGEETRTLSNTEFEWPDQHPQLGLLIISSDFCSEANRKFCVLVRMGCGHRQG